MFNSYLELLRWRMIPYIHHLHICVCMLCTGTDLPSLFCICFQSHSSKCPVVSCVQIVECSNVLVTQRKKTEFFTDGPAQDLKRLLLFIGQQHNSLAVPEMNLITACSSLAAIITYLEVRYWVKALCCDGSVMWWQSGVMAVRCDDSVVWWQCGVMAVWQD